MGGWDLLEQSKTNKMNTASQVNCLEETSGHMIRNNFSLLEKKFFQENRDYICKHSGAKLLLETPELQDITVQNIETELWKIHIETSTNFTGDLYQLLLDKGFSESILNQVTSPTGVRIYLNTKFNTLQILIKQKTLS